MHIMFMIMHRMFIFCAYHGHIMFIVMHIIMLIMGILCISLRILLLYYDYY